MADCLLTVDSTIIKSDNTIITADTTLIECGILSGGASLNLTAVAVRSAYGRRLGVATLTLTAQGNLGGGTDASGAASLTLTASASGYLKAGITGSASLLLTQSGAVQADGALSGSASLILNAQSQISGRVLITGAASLILTSSGQVIGGDVRNGEASLILTASGSITATGSLSGTANISLVESVSLDGRRKISGTASLTLNSSTILSDRRRIRGRLSIVFTLNAIPLQPNPVQGSAQLILTASGALSSDAIAVGALDLTLTASGALGGRRPISASTTLTLNARGGSANDDRRDNVYIDVNFPVSPDVGIKSFCVNPVIEEGEMCVAPVMEESIICVGLKSGRRKSLSGSVPFVISTQASAIGSISPLRGTSRIFLVASAIKKATIPISGSAILSFNESLSIKAKGRIGGTVQFSLNNTANIFYSLTQRMLIGGVATIRLNNTGAVVLRNTSPSDYDLTIIGRAIDNPTPFLNGDFTGVTIGNNSRGEPSFLQFQSQLNAIPHFNFQRIEDSDIVENDYLISGNEYIVRLNNTGVGGSTRVQWSCDIDQNYDVYHTKYDMYLHPSLATLEDYPNSNINWFNIWELWNENASDGAETRWNINLKKNTSVVGSPVYFQVRSRITVNGEWGAIYPYINSVDPVPFGVWFTMEVYWNKKTNEFKLWIDDKLQVNITNGQNSNPNFPDLYPTWFTPLKAYMSNEIYDWLKARGVTIEVKYRNFQWYKYSTYAGFLRLEGEADWQEFYRGQPVTGYQTFNKIDNLPYGKNVYIGFAKNDIEGFYLNESFAGVTVAPNPTKPSELIFTQLDAPITAIPWASYHNVVIRNGAIPNIAEPMFYQGKNAFVTTLRSITNGHSRVQSEIVTRQSSVPDRLHSRVNIWIHPHYNNVIQMSGSIVWIDIWELWYNDGDNRCSIYLDRHPSSGYLCFKFRSDEDGAYTKRYPDVYSSLPVPTGRWFDMEVIWERSTNRNRVLIDGQVVIDFIGVNDLPSNISYYQPIKHYVGQTVFNWMNSRGYEMTIAYSDFKILNSENEDLPFGVGSGGSFSGYTGKANPYQINIQKDEIRYFNIDTTNIP